MSNKKGTSCLISNTGIFTYIYNISLILLLAIKPTTSESDGVCDAFFKKPLGTSIRNHAQRFHPADTEEIISCLSPDLETEERSQCRFYASVIDAGSTGTRLHLFEFSHDITKEHSPFKLESETYKEIKPGLSSFAKTPQLAAEIIRELILTAKNIIPGNLWGHTPIALKATAGFRLLSEESAGDILTAVLEEVNKSGLLVNDDETVSILSGKDEGIFGWFTLNFLLGRLDDTLAGRNTSAVALDLGGGSTQVTLNPTDKADFADFISDEYFHSLSIFDKKLTLYTHSYLGNGLIAARLGICKLSTPEWTFGALPALKSHCLPKDFVLDDWDYSGNIWLISAHSDANFLTCLEFAKFYVKNVTGVRAVPKFEELDIYAFAYFHDRAVQAGIVDFTFDQVGGIARVEDYRIAAEKACSVPAESIGPDPNRPWQCLDLCYIYTLLRYGYSLPDNKSINLVKKLRYSEHKMEVSWALGAGFHLLNTYHSSELKLLMQVQAEKELDATLQREKKLLEQQRIHAQEVNASDQAKSFFALVLEQLKEIFDRSLVSFKNVIFGNHR